MKKLQPVREVALSVALAIPFVAVSEAVTSDPLRIDAFPCADMLRIDVKTGESLLSVRDRVRAAREGFRDRRVDVVFPSGAYAIRETLALDARDGGMAAAPVRWRTADGAKVIVFSGVRLKRATLVTTDDVNFGRLDAKACGRVCVCNLAGQNVQFWESPQEATQMLPLPDLIIDGEAYHPAEWPNGATNWATIAAFRDSGCFAVSDDYVHYSRCRILTDEAGKEKWTKVNGGLPSGGLFKYEGDRPSRWLKSPEILLHGFWAFDWHSGIVPVKTIDTEKHEIRLALNYHYGIRQGNNSARRWKAVHILEELDAPGEYYVDRWNQRLYFLPMRPLGEDSEIVLVSSTKPLVTLNGLSHFCLQGLEFTGSKADAVVGHDLAHVTFENLVFHDVSSLALKLENVYRCQVKGCDFLRTGTGAVYVSGGNRKTLEPGRNVIEDCLFRDYSQRKKSQGYALQTHGVGNVARHCLFTGGGHQVTLTCGNDNVIEWCVISNCVNATGDAGACYQGRNPSARGNVIRNCLFTDVGNSTQGVGTCCIYYDDGDGGNTVEGCIFENCDTATPKGKGYGAVFSHGGHSNRIVNCEFRNCSRPFGSTPWDQERWIAFVNGPLMERRMTKEVDVRKEPYFSRYFDLRDFFKPEADEVRWNHAERNLIVDCGEMSGRWTTNGNASVVGKIKNFRPIPRARIGLVTPR